MQPCNERVLIFTRVTSLSVQCITHLSRLVRSISETVIGRHPGWRSNKLGSVPRAPLTRDIVNYDSLINNDDRY